MRIKWIIFPVSFILLSTVHAGLVTAESKVFSFDGPPSRLLGNPENPTFRSSVSYSSTPFSFRINFTGVVPGTFLTLSMYSISGKKNHSANYLIKQNPFIVEWTENSAGLSALSTGIYFLRFSYLNKKYTRKFSLLE